MVKQKVSSQLVRSDLRLMGLGLFSVALLLGVFSVFNVNLASTSPTSDNIAERTIKVEEEPTAFGSELQNLDNSYAAEDFMMELTNEASRSSEMMDKESY